MTIPDADKNDFKAVCSKLMSQYPEELAEGSLSQAEFKKIQVKHFNIWSENASASCLSATLGCRCMINRIQGNKLDCVDITHTIDA